MAEPNLIRMFLDNSEFSIFLGTIELDLKTYAKNLKRLMEVNSNITIEEAAKYHNTTPGIHHRYFILS
jgi:hypothetical protein